MADQGYEQPQYGNKEAMGPTYDTVVSEKQASLAVDPQDPHYTGQLLPSAHSRSDEVRSFFDATSISG